MARNMWCCVESDTARRAQKEVTNVVLPSSSFITTQSQHNSIPTQLTTERTTKQPTKLSPHPLSFISLLLWPWTLRKEKKKVLLSKKILIHQLAVSASWDQCCAIFVAQNLGWQVWECIKKPVWRNICGAYLRICAWMDEWMRLYTNPTYSFLTIGLSIRYFTTMPSPRERQPWTANNVASHVQGLHLCFPLQLVNWRFSMTTTQMLWQVFLRMPRSVYTVVKGITKLLRMLITPRRY